MMIVTFIGGGIIALQAEPHKSCREKELLIAANLQAAFTASVSIAGVRGSDLPFFAGDFFALAGADLAFAGLAFDCAFLAAGFGFWAFAFAFLSLAQRAFAAALIFALAAAESLRFCGAAASTVGPADG
jgi:hypothetical protein